MIKIIKDATESTPSIIYNAKANLVLFDGVSYPENPVEFYKPVITWLTDHIVSMRHTLIMKFKLTYLNTSSIRVFLNVFKIIETTSKKEKEIKIEWICDPENDMALDYGNFFKKRVNIEFTIIVS